MDAIARELNQILGDSVAQRTLSRFGKSVYFPRGIVAQSQEAGREASVANASAGVALADGHHMSLSFLADAVSSVSIDQMVSYAPTAGDPILRNLWRNEMVRKNPLLANSSLPLPVVTAGLTHALSIAGDLFVDQGDTVMVPAPCWDNYELLFHVRHGANLLPFQLFDEQLRFSLAALSDALNSVSSGKVIVLLNFPHNPTGYTPSPEEAARLCELLVQKAQSGTDVVVLIDDAYFGLFHENEVFKQSLFSLLKDAHENLLTVKCDAATKEALVWGFRIGFITWNARGMDSRMHQALEQKIMGVIRSSVSSCSRIGQSLLVEAMQQKSYRADVDAVGRKIGERYAIVKQEIERRGHVPHIRPYPFNSGYFCTLRCACNAEVLRGHLLEHHGIGTVSLGSDMIRIAYSAVDADSVPDLIDKVYRSAEKLWM